MTWQDILVIVIIALLFAGIITYIVVQKRKGAKCIGCSACTSSKKESGCGQCSGSYSNKEEK